MKIVRHSEIRIRFSSDAVQAGRSAGHVAQDVLLNGSCPITAALTVRPSVNHSGSFRDSCFFRHIRGHFTEYLRGIHQTVRKKVRRQIQLLKQRHVPPSGHPVKRQCTAGVRFSCRKLSGQKIPDIVQRLQRLYRFSEFLRAIFPLPQNLRENKERLCVISRTVMDPPSPEPLRQLFRLCPGPVVLIDIRPSCRRHITLHGKICRTLPCHGNTRDGPVTSDLRIKFRQSFRQSFFPVSRLLLSAAVPGVPDTVTVSCRGDLSSMEVKRTAPYPG